MVQLLSTVASFYVLLGLGLWQSAPPASWALSEVLFRCPPCSPERLAACPPAPAPADPDAADAACPELVREPGCGCCPVCARLEGESCGVYMPHCASGLRCYPRPGVELPLQTLMHGQGTCARGSDEAEHGAAAASIDQRGTENEEQAEGSIAENVVDGATSPVNGACRSRTSKNGRELAVIREKVIELQKQMGKHIKLPANEQRPSSPRTPCQQELDQVLERISTMRLPDERGPLEHLYALNIPNCDKQGLYNLKQCKLSVNGQRGECWCVNPYTGKPIQGSPTIRGDPECHLYYTEQEQEDRGAQGSHVQ